jgi:autotransporter-associated beta strand protein
MIQTRPGQTSMEVRVVYRIQSSTFASALLLDDPEVPGISAERTIWTVTVPKGWRVDDRFKTLFGNMEMISAEGHEVERLNKMLSDFQTINRYLGSNAGNLSEADNKRVQEEAKKLGEEIMIKQQVVLTENRIQKPIFNDVRSSQVQAWQSKVANDLDNVSKELQRQNEVLVSNGGKVSLTKSGAGALNIGGGNVWSFNGNNTVTGKDQVTTGNKLIGFNDNVGVNFEFFDQGVKLDLNGTNTFTGAIAMNGGTLRWAGANNTLSQTRGITLKGSNTYSGDTTISAGTAIVQKLSEEAVLPQIQNNSRAFNSAGNTQLNGGALAYDAPQIPQNPAERGVRFGTATIVPGSVDGLISGVKTRETSTLSPKQYTAGGKVLDEKQVEELKRDADKAKTELGLVAAAPADPFAKPEAPPAPMPESRLVLGSWASVSGGANEFTGATTISGGAFAGTLAANNAAATSGAISGTGGRAIDGAGTLNLSGAISTSNAVNPMGGNYDTRLRTAGSQATALVSEATPQSATFTSQPGAIRLDASTNELKLGDTFSTTQLVNQLRPTGRRSLALSVPSAGEVFHFRKLKDHAVIDLTLKHDWPQAKVTQATTFGAGLGLWALAALVMGRRTKRAK